MEVILPELTILNLPLFLIRTALLVFVVRG